MQSPLAIVLRVSVLFGCLVYLPLAAAGGLSAPEKMFTQAKTWLATHSKGEPLFSPCTIQVELPTEALRYRAVGSPVELAWDEPAELEEAEVVPANYEEILPPDSHDTTNPGPEQPWSADAADSSPNRIPDDEQVFELGERKDLPANAALADVEDRLRELGAVEVRLEPWGSTGQFYRYWAVIPLAGSADVHRHFQAIGPSPDQAALEVLAQVAASAGQ